MKYLFHFNQEEVNKNIHGFLVVLIGCSVFSICTILCYLFHYNIIALYETVTPRVYLFIYTIVVYGAVLVFFNRKRVEKLRSITLNIKPAVQSLITFCYFVSSIYAAWFVYDAGQFNQKVLLVLFVPVIIVLPFVLFFARLKKTS